MQRKSLASQLNRLDSIFDLLDQALHRTIADTANDAVPTAVAEAVRATLMEIVSNHQVISLLLGVTTPVVSPPGDEEAKPSGAHSPKLHVHVRRGLTAAWRWSLRNVVRAKCRPRVEYPQHVLQ